MIPAIQAKTTALFVDDDKQFLDDLNDLLPKTYFFKAFTNPLEALEATKFYIQPNFLNQELLMSDFESTNFESVLSVIIVDHRMKPIDGIEFCKRLSSNPSKRIMLTSHATKDLAIKAFNNKLIDAFLLKTEDDLLSKLSSTIQRCTTEFFKDISTGIDGFKTKHNPLANDELSKFFFSFCADNKIHSHCCFHDFHNILLKDINNKETYITLYDSEHIDDLLASEQAKSAKPYIIDRITNKQAAPCFKDTSSTLIPDGITWDDYMVPLKPITKDLLLAIS